MIIFAQKCYQFLYQLRVFSSLTFRILSDNVLHKRAAPQPFLNMKVQKSYENVAQPSWHAGSVGSVTADNNKVICGSLTYRFMLKVKHFLCKNKVLFQ